ncbi:MAG TPA: hypothetical protein VL181_08730, partial [Holophagaceae bacterium]|nr:hypothetical protein [Holophagaceae bacterium]
FVEAGRMKRAALLLLLAALPASAQSFADDTPFGGSLVFSEGENPRANPARFDQLPSGWYAGVDVGDLKPRGASLAADAVANAEQGGGPMDSALSRLGSKPWATRERLAGLAWAWEGGIRFGYTHEDLRGTFAVVDPASSHAALDGRQAVVDRLYAGAGSQAGRSALGFTVRLERVRFGEEAFALQPQSGQLPLGDPAAPLNGVGTDHAATSATLDAGYLYDAGEHARLGFTLDRIASRRFGDLKEDPQARAGLQVDLSPSFKLSFESDLNSAARLPIAVKRRVTALSLQVELSPTASLTAGAERRKYEGAPASTVLGAALHLRMAPLVLSLGLRLGDDRPLAAAALRLPGV